MCAENCGAVLEFVYDGSVIAIMPTGSEAGVRNSLLEMRSLLCAPLSRPGGGLASPSDKGPRDVSGLRDKMVSYQANGARLGLLLLPHERAVEKRPRC